MKVYYWAIVLGLLTDFAASTVVSILLVIFHLPPEGTEIAVFALILGLPAITLGGYVTARKSLTDKYFNTFIMGTVDLLLSIPVAYFAVGDSVPVWFHILAFILTIPAAVLGGYFVHTSKKT
jgi:hypothetical protein